MTDGLEAGTGPWSNVPSSVRQLLFKLSSQSEASADRDGAQRRDLARLREEVSALKSTVTVQSEALQRVSSERRAVEAELRELQRWRQQECDRVALKGSITCSSDEAAVLRRSICFLERQVEDVSRTAAAAAKAAAAAARGVSQGADENEPPPPEIRGRQRGAQASHAEPEVAQRGQARQT